MAQADPQNILLIHFGQLGDVVLALPAIKAVRDRFPGSHIVAMTGLVSGQIVQLSGLVDEVIAVDRVELRDGPVFRSIGKILRLVSGVRQRDLDLVIDLHSLKETNILAWLSRAEKRLLADRGNRSFHSLGNFDPPPPVEDRDLPLSETYMRVLAPLGIKPMAMPVMIRPDEKVRRTVLERIFSNVDLPLAGLFPGAGHPNRRWPLKNFADLAARLRSDGMTPVVFLGPEEISMLDDVVREFGSETLIVDGLSIEKFITATAELDVFITNDTGPMHLAALGGAPIVLIMHSEAPLTYLPLAAKLKIVNPTDIGSIPVADVHAAVVGILARASGGK